MINARNKLKAYKGPILCIIQDKYKRTKFLGIEYCKHMIQESNQSDEWLDLFDQVKKKDLLSRCLFTRKYVLGLKYLFLFILLSILSL